MINQKRIRKINNLEIGKGPILYWMNRDMRTEDNWSLLYAQKLAEENQVPLIAFYNLINSFLGGTTRHLTFKVDALKEIEEELKEKEIPFFVLVDEDGKESQKQIFDFIEKHKAGAVVTDFYPLNLPKKWLSFVSKNIDCALVEVDSHNIIPVWETSDKKEYAAYTIRPKIHEKLKEFLDEFPKLKKQKYLFDKKFPEINWDKILPEDKREEMDWIKSGQKSAKKHLKNFIENKLDVYAEKRNDPNANAQSGFSPYLHYGMISAQRIVLDILKEFDLDIENVTDEKKNLAKGEDSVAAFFEELIVRRELSDNFCYYESNYDSVECFPDWAKKSLKKSQSDKREYIYTKKQFENAETHDDLWNAAQVEMVKTGKMHGYMRMYWAKKILEWTKNVEDALEIAIYLNDKYELDGRDPNGYAGIAWSIGGVHDRPWFDRKIFGQIRYMAKSGCDKKFDTEAYISKWL
ncbi:MAG: Deoxyribodipyrimidine photolyase [Bacteroidota bacterium]